MLIAVMIWTLGFVSSIIRIMAVWNQLVAPPNKDAESFPKFLNAFQGWWILLPVSALLGTIMIIVIKWPPPG